MTQPGDFRVSVGENDYSRPIVVYGAGGHGKVVADILCSMGLAEQWIGYLDDSATVGTIIMGKPVLGGFDWLTQNEPKAAVALGIGSNSARQKVANRCKELGLELFVAIHSTAYVSRFAKIAAGTVVMAKAAVNPEAQIGEGVIVNTAAVIEHDVVLGDYSHVSPNAAFGGAASLGALSHLGVGVSVLPCIRVGARSTVGAGAVVNRDLPDDVVAVGVPARIIRRLR